MPLLVPSARPARRPAARAAIASIAGIAPVALVALVALALFTQPIAVARADRSVPPGRADATSPTPAERLDLVRGLLSEAGDAGTGREQAARLARGAIAHLDVLIARTPADPELHWLAARAWLLADTRLEVVRSDPAIVERAIAAAERARALSPGGARADDIATLLGDLHGRVGRYARAVDEYDRAIALRRAWLDELHLGRNDELARLYGNSAESLMAMGDLAAAIERYRLAASYQSSSARLPSLPWWGLAVSLDRDGQIEAARQALRRAVELDPHLGAFSDTNVYFVPRGDRWYYLGLAYAEQGERAAAAAAFRRFLDETPESPWLGRARAHLDVITRWRKEDATGEGRLALLVTARRPADVRAIRAVVTASARDLRMCLDDRDDESVLLALAVRPDGSVEHAHVGTPDGPVAPGCLDEIARRWRLPAGASAVTVLVRDAGSTP